MTQTKVFQRAWKWFWKFVPVFAVLLFTVLFSVLFSDASSTGKWESVYKTSFRFFRFTLFLCLPLYLVLPLYSRIVAKLRGSLVQTGKEREFRILPWKHWVFRPFQGIGIGLLFETRLLAVLQLVTGEPTRPFHFLPPEQFQPGRFLVITGISVLISLLFSTLWAFDDMGIRHVNEKNQEMKMMGKYAGTLMPIIFGFYGIYSLVASFQTVEAFGYLFKIIIVLYPPFAALAIFHNRFLRNRMDRFSQAASLEVGGVWRSSIPSA
ncbi:MAG: hypothetical protein A2170_03195 [Deltaproteobacteria bacterium RBG_13_53_10]|nr:MAG: hypothetical protein A2170_03195 [Deltaproteobacteria bacterium RBG_13_53_10]